MLVGLFECGRSSEVGPAEIGRSLKVADHQEWPVIRSKSS